MVLQKIFGMVLILVGLYFVIALPGMSTGGPGTGSYMPDSFARVIILIGLILTGVGIFLLVKG